MKQAPLKWTRSKNGHMETTDGRFKIKPVFLQSRVRTEKYLLYYNGELVLTDWTQQGLWTQALAKELAERINEDAPG